MSSIPDLNKLFSDISKSENIQLVEWLFFGFILVGIIIKFGSGSINITYTDDEKSAILAGEKHSVGPATGSIWGYSVILFAILGLIFISVNPQKENMAQIENIPLSLYIIVIIVIWSIIMNFRFYDKINITTTMPAQYKKWSDWSFATIIILSIFCVLEYCINVIKSEDYKSLKPQLRIFAIIVGFSGMIVMGIQDTILNNFLVDG